jgi:Tat protein translocase TatB subunit
MGDLGFSEMIAIAVIAILVYGKELPQAARKLAALYSKLRRQVTDIKDEIQRQIPDEEIKSLTNAAHYDPGLDPPTIPESVTVSPSADQVVVSWIGSLGATSYTIKRSAGPAEPFYVIAMSVYELSYTDSDVKPGQTYHYVVVATNSAGESAPSDEAIVTLPGTAAAEPSAPPPPSPIAEAPPPPAESAPPPPSPAPLPPSGGAPPAPDSSAAAGDVAPTPIT